jgi:hypothetical protein
MMNKYKNSPDYFIGTEAKISGKALKNIKSPQRSSSRATKGISQKKSIGDSKTLPANYNSLKKNGLEKEFKTNSKVTDQFQINQSVTFLSKGATGSARGSLRSPPISSSIDP